MNKEVNSVRFDTYSVGIIMNIFHADIPRLKYNCQLYSLRWNGNVLNLFESSTQLNYYVFISSAWFGGH